MGKRLKSGTKQARVWNKKQSLLCEYKEKAISTPAELAFEALLEKHNIQFISQKGWIVGRKTFCISDFYLPKLKLVVEIDGGYHDRLQQITKDLSKDRYVLKERKFSVLRIQNDVILKDPERAWLLIQEIMGRTRKRGFFNYLGDEEHTASYLSKLNWTNPKA